jgi:hypothetical protein
MRNPANSFFRSQDARARQYGWTVEVRPGGLSRRYRDPRFDSLARERMASFGDREPAPGWPELPTAWREPAMAWLAPGLGAKPELSEKEVKAVIGLLTLIAAAAGLIALPALGQLLRAMMGCLVRLVAAVFLVAVALTLLAVLLTHGMLT